MSIMGLLNTLRNPNQAFGPGLAGQAARKIPAAGYVDALVEDEAAFQRVRQEVTAARQLLDAAEANRRHTCVGAA